MGAISSSSNHNFQDILSSLSEQNIQSIASFLDLKSLENLQLVNRRMRYLFVSSLWNRLFIITFNPVRNQNEETHINIIVAIENQEELQNSVEMPLREIYTYEMFQKRWFERYPNLILEERRRLKRERQAQIEHALQNRKNKMKRCLELFNRSALLEQIILWGFFFFFLVCMCLFQDRYACSENRCYVFLSEKLINCNGDYISYSGFPFLTLVLFFSFGLWDLIFNNEISFDPEEALVHEHKTLIRIIIKLLVYIGAVILYLPLNYIPLSDSECNGFSVETNDSLCTITTTFEVTQFLLFALTFIPAALLQFFNIYLISYATYTCCKPIHPLNRPLLLD